MDKDIRKIVDERSFDTLVATPHEIDVFTATLRQTEAAQSLKAGTILALSETDGKYVILGTEAQTTTVDETEVTEVLKANAILAEDVTTSTSADVNITAFRQGHFNRKAIAVKSGYTITDADIEELRSAGIYLETEI